MFCRHVIWRSDTGAGQRSRAAGPRGQRCASHGTQLCEFHCSTDPNQTFWNTFCHFLTSKLSSHNPRKKKTLRMEPSRGELIGLGKTQLAKLIMSEPTQAKAKMSLNTISPYPMEYQEVSLQFSSGPALPGHSTTRSRAK